MAFKPRIITETIAIPANLAPHDDLVTALGLAVLCDPPRPRKIVGGMSMNAHRLWTGTLPTGFVVGV